MAALLRRGATAVAGWFLAVAALAVAAEAAGPAGAVLNAYVGPANVATASNLTVTLANCTVGTELFLVDVDLSGVPALHTAYDVVLPEDGTAPEADGTVTFRFVLGPKACDATFTPAPAGIYYVTMSVSTSADGAATNTTTHTSVPMVLQDLNAQPRGNDWCGRHAMVAVTQDDGPNTDPRGTTAIAASLAAMNVSAMFFVTALDVNATDRCIRTQWLVEQGHTIGSHTYSHPDITTLTDAELLTELVINDEWIYHCLGGLTVRVFRPPYGRLTQRQVQLINSFGFTIGYWSDVIDDASDTTPEATLAYFKTMFQAHDDAYADDDLLRPSIVTNSHDYGGHLPDVFAIMVPYLRSLNYTFVTFDECLAGCGADADGLCKDPKTHNMLDRVWPYDDQNVPAPRLPWSNPACVAATDAPLPEFPSAPVDVPTRPPPPPPACVYRSLYNVLEVTPSYYFNNSTCLILYDSLYSYLAEVPVVNDLASLPLGAIGSPKTSSFYVEGYGGADCSAYLAYFMCTYVVDDGPPSNAPCVIGADGFLTVTTANANAACVAVFSRVNYTHLYDGATSGSPSSARISPYAHQGILELTVEVYGHHDCSGTLLEMFTCDAYYPVTGTAPPPPTLPPTAPPTVAPPSMYTFQSPNGDYELRWLFTSDGYFVDIVIEAVTSGWVGVGFNDVPSMTHADMYIGWLDPTNGTAVVVDCFATEHEQPPRDVEFGGADNVANVAGTRSDGKTTIYFRRPTAASDAWDVAMTGNLYILWAYGNAPDIVSARALVGPNASSRVAVALLPKHTAAGAAFANVQSGVWRYADGIYLDPAAVLLCFAAGVAVIAGMARLAGLVYTPTDLARPSPAPRVAVDFELEEAGSVTSGSVCRSSSFAPLVSPKSRSTADAAVNAGSEFATAAKAPSNASAKDELDEPSIHLSFLNLRRRVPGVDIPAWALLIVLVYVAINIASAYLGISADAASTLGSLAIGNGFLVALPVTRKSVLWPFVGISHERLLLLHGVVALAIVVLATAHAGLHWSQWASMPATLATTNHTFGVVTNTYGFAAWVCLLVVFILALPLIRRTMFNVFYRSHFLFVAFYVFAALHHPRTRPYVYATAAVYALDRLIRMYRNLRSRDRAMVVITASTTTDRLLRVRVPRTSTGTYFGQYVMLYLPEVSVLEAHPFLVTSSPMDDTYELFISECGDYTRRIVDVVGESGWLRAYVEGPYGGVALRYRNYRSLFLVAGGVGLAPILGILRDIYRDGEHPGNNRPDTLAGVFVVWVIRNLSEYALFSQELDELRTMGRIPDDIHRRPPLHLAVFATHDLANKTDDEAAALTAEAGSRCELVVAYGQPDLRGLFFAASRMVGVQAPQFVYACGPKQLVSATWDVVSAGRSAGIPLNFFDQSLVI